jgi:hypothetical protein
VLTTSPLPPARLVPPMTAAVIAENSRPWPASGCTELVRPMAMSEPSPTTRPVTMYAENSTSLTGTPLAMAALRFPPVA